MTTENRRGRKPTEYTPQTHVDILTQVAETGKPNYNVLVEEGKPRMSVYMFWNYFGDRRGYVEKKDDGKRGAVLTKRGREYLRKTSARLAKEA